MTPERWRQIERLYHAALERDAAVRPAFLTEACGSDQELQTEVEALLSGDASLGRIGTGPAVSSAALSAGYRIGPYKIEELIGAGGMGQVYRAHDTRLGRDVAIKILPPHLTSDRERRARLEREARLLATLNHPHIADIYGVEDADDMRALVMELVPGPTLHEAMTGRAVPLEQALRLARQIAEALEYAHERGVIHRDLKPANVKVTPESEIKLLDFGLAKAIAGESANVNLANSPTVTGDGTRAGLVLGTAAYMAPEQAAARPVDRRADIWAFGVLLYEMLTGSAAYARDTLAETIAAVMKEEVDWKQLPADTPSSVRRMLRRCMEKDPRRRLRDIGEARVVLEAPEDHTEALAQPEPRLASRSFVFGTVATLLAVALAGVSWIHFRERPAEPIVVRSSILPPDGVVFNFSDDYDFGPPALSPDGRRLAFSARGADGKVRLWIRSLDMSAAQELAGSDGGMYPFWSYDTNSIGFFAAGKLRRIPASGGSAVPLADATHGRGGTWNRDNVIVFTPDYFAPLQRVSADGGAVTVITALDSQRAERSNRFPWFLPDGRHFLYSAQDIRTTYDRSTIRIGSLDSTESRVLFDADSNVEYAEGHLLYLRLGSLVAQPFDTERLVTTGDPKTVVDGVLGVKITSCGVFSVSTNGTLVYQTGTAEWASLNLSWWDRTTQRLSIITEAGPALTVNLSNDGTRATVSQRSPSNRGTDIWIYDLARGSGSRFTLTDGFKRAGFWSPGGDVFFQAPRDGATGPYVIFRRPGDGHREADLLFSDATDKIVTSIHPSGKFLLFSAVTSASDGTADLWVLPDPSGPLGPRQPTQFNSTRFAETAGRFSPDGNWIAYESNESQQRTEIIVAPFPGPGGKRPVSRAGGTSPRWRPDGKEIYFLSPDRKLMAAEVTTTLNTFSVGAIRTLPVSVIDTGVQSTYDVARDGRILLLTPPAHATFEPLTLIQNWTGELRAR